MCLTNRHSLSCLASEMEDGNRSDAASTSKSHAGSIHLQSMTSTPLCSCLKVELFNWMFCPRSKKRGHLWDCHPLWREQFWAAGIFYPEWSEFWRWVIILKHLKTHCSHYFSLSLSYTQTYTRTHKNLEFNYSLSSAVVRMWPCFLYNILFCTYVLSIPYRCILI